MSIAEAPDIGTPPDQIAEAVTHPPRLKPKSKKSIDLGLLGIQIVTHRAAAGLSQEELAKKAGVSKKTVKRVERGETEPSFDTLYRLSRALERTIHVKAN